MKKLMQHLLDGGKLVDERGYTLEKTEHTDAIRIRYNTGDGLEILASALALTIYLSKHDFKMHHDDGVYEVHHSASDERTVIISYHHGHWYSPLHTDLQLSEPFSIIRKIEGTEL